MDIDEARNHAWIYAAIGKKSLTDDEKEELAQNILHKSSDPKYANLFRTNTKAITSLKKALLVLDEYKHTQK